MPSPSVEPTGTARSCVIVIEGLDDWAIECSSLAFYRGRRSLGVVPIRAMLRQTSLRLDIPRDYAEWFAFVGNASGECPWTRYWLAENKDPNYIVIPENGDVKLVFWPRGEQVPGATPGSGEVPTRTPFPMVWPTPKPPPTSYPRP